MSGLQALMRSMEQGDVFNTPDYFPYEDNYEKNTSKGWKSLINKIKDQQKIEKELIVAEQAIKKKNYSTLLKESEKYTDKKLEKLHKKADKLISQRKFAKADEIYVDILKHRLDIHAMFMLGHLRMEEARDFTYALDVFNNILKLDPGNPRALFYTSWLLYILNDSRELANQRIKDLLRQGPQKNLLILLDFIKTRNILDVFVAIDYLHNVYNLLPKDLITRKELRKMENGIKQHIEVLKTRSFGQLDEYEDELPYSENIKVYDEDDDEDLF
jgi:tetratricopeptide (TPR) repeat protein